MSLCRDIAQEPSSNDACSFAWHILQSPVSDHVKSTCTAAASSSPVTTASLAFGAHPVSASAKTANVENAHASAFADE